MKKSTSLLWVKKRFSITFQSKFQSIITVMHPKPPLIF